MAGDPLWYYKVLGLHCDGANGSTTFQDVGPSPKTVTANGNAQISTSQYPALTGKTSSGYVDGTGDYLSVTGDTFGAGDFTVRGWIRVTTPSSAFLFFDSRVADNDSNGFALYVRSTSKLTFIYGNGVTVEGTTSILANTWYHVAVVRASGVVKTFLNGTQEASFSQGNTYSNTSWKIGHQWNAAGDLSSGYFSEVEIYKGVALHTTDFTPPTTPFLDEYISVSGTVKDSAGNFASRLVRVYRRDTGALVGSVLSNAATGAYKVAAANSGTTTPLKHFAILHDATSDPPGAPTENAIIYDNITPA